MQVRLLIFWLAGFVGFSQAVFDIEKIKITVKLVGTELTITTLSDNLEVTSIFFSTELDGECVAGYSYLKNLKSKNTVDYKHSLKRVVTEQDVLKIVGVFEFENQVITKSYDFKFDQNGNANKQIKEDVCLPTGFIPYNPQPLRKHNECERPEWIPNTGIKPMCSGQLILDENFDHNNVNLNWDHRIFSNIYGDHHEFAIYLKNDVNSRIEDGHLKITAQLAEYKNEYFEIENCTAEYMSNELCGPFRKQYKDYLPPVHSAMLRSIDSIKLKYGRYEIRAKMPIGEWLMPYILLMPHDVYLESSPSHHIRIAFVRGDTQLTGRSSQCEMGGSMVFGGTFTEKPVTGELIEEIKGCQSEDQQHYGNQFHNYTMIYHRDRMIFKVDGKTYHTLRNKKVLEQLNSKHAYSLVLGLTAGGAYNYPHKEVLLNDYPVKDAFSVSIFDEYMREKSEFWPQPNLIIDYVKVYATHPEED